MSQHSARTGLGASFVAMFAALSSATGCTVNSVPVTGFLGPQPGSVYVYRLDASGTMTVRGVAGGNHEVEVEETVAVPELTDPGTKPSRYVLLARDGKLIKKQGSNARVMLQEPVVVGGTRWSVPILTNVDGTTHTVPAVCEISLITEEHRLGQHRQVITVSCTAEGAELVTTTTERFAAGIGLVERAVEYRTRAGETFGKQIITLTDIRSKE